LETDDEIPEDGLNDPLPLGFPEDRKFKHIMKFPYLYQKIKENWCTEIYIVANKKYKDKAYGSYLNQRKSEAGNTTARGGVSPRKKAKTTFAKAGPIKFSLVEKDETPRTQVRKSVAHAISPFAGENISPSMENFDEPAVGTKIHVSILYLINNREERLIRNSKK
jgi:hypothetical protein